MDLIVLIVSRLVLLAGGVYILIKVLDGGQVPEDIPAPHIAWRHYPRRLP